MNILDCWSSVCSLEKNLQDEKNKNVHRVLRLRHLHGSHNPGPSHLKNFFYEWYHLHVWHLSYQPPVSCPLNPELGDVHVSRGFLNIYQTARSYHSKVPTPKTTDRTDRKNNYSPFLLFSFIFTCYMYIYNDAVKVRTFVGKKCR